MSLARFAKKRDAVEPEIVRALRAVGAHVWQLDRPFDLLVGLRGRFTVLECKSSTRVRNDQQHQTDEITVCRAAGLPVYRVQSVNEAIEAITRQPHRGS